MSIKYFLISLVLVFLFSACSLSDKKLLIPLKKVTHAKVFEEEDTLIMFALRSEELKDFKTATDIFDTLYEKSEKKEYLYRSLQNKLYIKDNESVIQRVEYISRGSYEDYALIRLKIVALIQSQRYDEALKDALELVKLSELEDDYILVSDIYTAKQEFVLAQKYLESAYMQDYSEKILDRMSIILYLNLDRKKDAIAYLETHTRIHGCSILICKRLIAFYSNENNTEGLLSTYLRYYKLDTNEDVAKQIVQLYAYKKEFNKIILFLESSGSDDKTLLELYMSSKNYKKAAPLAKKIYKETGEVKYLGESIIFEYEIQEDKNNPKFLEELSLKFEELLLQESNSLYLNYYGYILIDHDLDVNKGIYYVKKALELEPDSVYFLDSLAWGYYKVGECKKAMDIIKRVVNLEGGDNPEVREHFTKIKQCKGKK